MIDGTIELLDDLGAAGFELLGLSNFSAETFPLCRDTHPVFDRFSDIVLSGDLGVAKPDPLIYTTLLDRNGIEPRRVVFIDDSPQQRRGGRLAVGMSAVHFHRPRHHAGPPWRNSAWSSERTVAGQWRKCRRR